MFTRVRVVQQLMSRDLHHITWLAKLALVRVLPDLHKIQSDAAAQRASTRSISSRNHDYAGSQYSSCAWWPTRLLGPRTAHAAAMQGLLHDDFIQISDWLCAIVHSSRGQSDTHGTSGASTEHRHPNRAHEDPADRRPPWSVKLLIGKYKALTSTTGKMTLSIPPYMTLDHDQESRKATLSIHDRTVRRQREMWGTHSMSVDMALC